MKRDDTLWKGVLENLFDDFLRFFFPDADKLFDMKKRFQFLDKELEQLFPLADNMQSSKFVDKPVKVFTKAGKEEWLLVHELSFITENRKTTGIEEMVPERAKKEGLEKGLQKGKAEGKAEVVSNLLLKMAMTGAQAADIAGVAVDSVKKIRRKLKK